MRRRNPPQRNKFYEAGDHGVRHDDTPEQLAEKLYNDPDYFENNPRGYQGMAQAARVSDWHDKFCEGFNQVIPVKGQRLLDAGCATGAFLRPFIAMGADAYGIELSTYASKIATEVLGPGRVECGSVHELKAWPDNHFDIYFTAEVIEHVPYRYHLDMTREAMRVCKPGALIYWQGQIGFKDYLNPDPNDDAGHIAVLPRGYWIELLEHVGLQTAQHYPDLEALEAKFGKNRRWIGYSWKYLVARKP